MESSLTLAQLVRQRAAREPDRIGYSFLDDSTGEIHSLTWSQLHKRAGARAAAFVTRGAARQPVLLALPSSLAFVESLFACWYAGAIAVPVSLPRHQRVKHRLDRVLAGSAARFAVGGADIRQRLAAASGEDPSSAALEWIDDASANDQGVTEFEPRAQPGDISVLQYTSGSTGAPRGVMVSHANLMCNSAQIAEALGHDAGSTIGGWLPLYHDMGLVGLLQAAFTGARCIFMAPERFLMRPASWLQMISDYRVCSSPAPNFAYDLCVERVNEEEKRPLDLSHWRNALNGAEPVRAATLDRFARSFASCGFRSTAFFPCYGMAEATLFVTGPGPQRKAARRMADGSPLPDGAASGHVGCGRAHGDTRIAIVDPHTSRKLADGEIGEIWVSGGSCAAGYWNDPQATALTFAARLQADSPEDSQRNWLRTGDLGMIADGELFVTGRLRELIIIAGRNLFPVDLERTAESADPAIAPFGVAAISTDAGGSERLIILAEIRREFARPGRARSQKERPQNAGPDGDRLPPTFDPAATIRHIRAAVAAEHDVTPRDVVLLSPGALPRTTSGKLSRITARDNYLNQGFEPLEIPLNAPAGA
jgi:acyl-CoA synthetase (AMP-forming)/AMP-acid ligase II